jgi:hypothetical protein
MEPRMDNGVNARDLDARETVSLIGSDKVEGTSVYNRADEKIGKIERIMIDKVSGKVAYAVLSFGGFLGIGDDHYPIPWSKLSYDERVDGYRTDVSKAELEGAPKYRSDEEFDWENRETSMGVYNHYGIPPYWI